MDRGLFVPGKDALTLSPLVPIPTARRLSRSAWILWLLACGLPTGLRGQVQLPIPHPQAPIRVRAAEGRSWDEGAYRVWELKDCQITQGLSTANARQAVLWVQPGRAEARQPDKIIAYLEGDARVSVGRPTAATNSILGPQWLGRFFTVLGVQVDVARQTSTGGGESALVQRARLARAREGQPTGRSAGHPGSGYPVQAAQYQAAQYQAPAATGIASQGGVRSPGPSSVDSNLTSPSTPGTPPATGAAPAGAALGPQATPPAGPSAGGRRFNIGGRNVWVESRGNQGFQLQLDQGATSDETIIRISRGVRITIEGLEVRGVDDLGTLSIETDRIVIWTRNVAQLARQANSEEPIPFEIYLEGNIVFRQGERVIYAQRMYYDVQREAGAVLDAEILTPVDQYQGLVRLKADVMQQVNRQSFVAYGAALTSSRLAVPNYWVQAERVEFHDRQRAETDPVTGQPLANPWTGDAELEHELLASSSDNFLYVGGFPVFYWPRLATDLTKPTYYVNGLRFRNDSIFGFQALVDLDAYQLLGWQQPPDGTQWTLSTDLLSDRGFGLGSRFEYNRDLVFGIPGPARGFLDAWGLNDTGLDNLGADRRGLVPEESLRGRVLAKHRQQLGGGWQFSGELGWISDRNFLEQYYEREWDEQKDQTTGGELKRYFQNRSLSLTVDTRPNGFFTDTEWLPRVDHFVIGQPLLGRLTWHAHSHVGYARLRTLSTPADPADAAKFQPRPWEAQREGLRAATRQELDLPLEAGPVKVVPFLAGELARWEEDLRGESLTRTLGQVGVRTNLPLWRVDPTVQSSLFNLQGLAHKIELQSELLFAEASQDLDRLPLYDPLDDNNVEHFRRRYVFDTFDPVRGIPLPFDERSFAVREGIQRWVSATSTEVAEDQFQARLALKQRWQTKRGVAGQRRIIDWVVLNVEGIVFPKPGRDNFGQEFGLVNYDFRWHVGDRLTLLSDGYADLFADGLRTVSFGGLLSRPELGTLYLGYRSLEGPLSSNFITAAIDYRMSEKWIASFSSIFDLGQTGNIGQRFSVTRIGESALVKVGFTFDESRDNIGLQFAIEPRFLPSSRLGRVGGVQIPPAGAFGVE